MIINGKHKLLWTFKKEASKRNLKKKRKKGLFQRYVTFERSEIEIIKKKAKTFYHSRHWWICCNLHSWFHNSLPCSIKTAVPFLVRVDNSTGYTDIAPQLSDAKEKVIRMLRLNISCQNISLTMKHTTGRLSGTGRYSKNNVFPKRCFQLMTPWFVLIPHHWTFWKTTTKLRSRLIQ